MLVSLSLQVYINIYIECTILLCRYLILFPRKDFIFVILIKERILLVLILSHYDTVSDNVIM